jgi:hypothetical protein
MLSLYLSEEALTRSGCAAAAGNPNTPSPTQRAALMALAINVLDPLWVQFGGLQRISGFRTAVINNSACVGSNNNSQHIKGEAADVKPVEGTSRDLMEYLYLNPDIPVGQVILYHASKGGHVHVSHRASGNNRRFQYQPASGPLVPWYPSKSEGIVPWISGVADKAASYVQPVRDAAKVAAKGSVAFGLVLLVTIAAVFAWSKFRGSK